jgi:hypothetical protein
MLSDIKPESSHLSRKKMIAEDTDVGQLAIICDPVCTTGYCGHATAGAERMR